MKLSHPAILETRPPEEFTNYRKLNIERLHEDIEENLVLPPTNRNLRNNEIDDAVNNIETTVCGALDRQKVPKTSRDRYHHLPELVQNLYSHRQRLRKRLQRINQRDLHTTSQQYQALKSELECTNTMFRNSIRHHNDIAFMKKLQQIKPGPDAFKEISRLIGKHKPLPEVMIKSDNTELTSMVDKVEAFANHFEQSFTPSPPADPAFLSEVETSILQLTQQPKTQIFEFNNDCPADNPGNSERFCNPEELTEIISNLRPKKSTGMDGISSYILKRLPQVFYDSTGDYHKQLHKQLLLPAEVEDC